MLSYTLGVIQSIEKIFAGVLVGALEKDNPDRVEIIRATKINRNKFIGTFPSNVFQDEYAIFYSILSDLNIKVFTVDELDTIVHNNRDLILNSPYVDISKLSNTLNGSQATDDEKIEAIKANLKELLVTLSNRFVTETEFESACDIFTDWFREQFMLETTQNMSIIMSDRGCDVKLPGKRSRLYRGYEDCRKYYNERMRILNELYAKDKVRSMLIDSKWFESEMQRENIEDDNALMTVGIKEIDDTIGNLRRGNMLGILGPPKGGKTRFTNFLVSRALELGLNVCVWTLEGTKEEWIAMQIASMIRRDNSVSFNSKEILENKYKDNKHDRQMVTSAKMKLSCGEHTGRLSFIESTAYVEDFIDVLQGHYESQNPFDVLVIDQLIDILSRTGRGKVERISQAYQELKIYITTGMTRPALAIMPGQLKQDVVDHLRKNPNETMDVTAGGESAETIRTPDEVLGLFSSKEERASGQMHIYSVASRHSGNFDDFRVRAELKCCHFYSDPNLA